MKKQAFTMIELVMVIVVLGILAALAMPRLDRDLRQEAKDNILSAIRYTQHLALVDDKTVPGTSWQKTLWKITFSTSGNNLANFYTVSSDADLDGSVDKVESAIDPFNGKYMYNLGGNTVIDSDESPNVFIGKTYGINNIEFDGGCNNTQHIAFDNLGRPHTGIGGASNDYSKYMTTDCTIEFQFADASITPLTVTIATETGYVSAD